MTTAEAIKRIQEAMVPDLPKSPWRQGSDAWAREVREAEGRSVAWCGQSPERKAHAVAAYIAACDPEAMTEIFASHAALLEAARIVVSADDEHALRQIDINNLRAAIRTATESTK